MNDLSNIFCALLDNFEVVVLSFDLFINLYNYC